MKECIICHKKQENYICKACIAEAGNNIGKGAKMILKAAPLAMVFILNKGKK